MAITGYLRALDVDARTRHEHETRRGQVVSFVVQLEVALTFAENDVAENRARYRDEFLWSNS